MSFGGVVAKGKRRKKGGKKKGDMENRREKGEEADL